MIEHAVSLVVAVLGGGGIATMINWRLNKRKALAEVALVEEKVEGESWGRFQAEIARLDRSIAECELHKEAQNKMLAQQQNEIALMRHRLNNEVMSTEALLMIIESHADTLPLAITKAIVAIRKMRTEAQAHIALERASVVEKRMEMQEESDES